MIVKELEQVYQGMIRLVNFIKLHNQALKTQYVVEIMDGLVVILIDRNFKEKHMEKL